MSFTSNKRVTTSKPVKANADMDVLIANAEYLLDASDLSICRTHGLQIVPNSTATACDLDDIVDTDGYFNAGTPKRLTIPSGINHCQFNIQYAFTLCSPGLVYMSKNGDLTGSNFSGRPLIYIYGDMNGNLRTPMLEVTPGDYFELIISQTTGGNILATYEFTIQGWV